MLCHPRTSRASVLASRQLVVHCASPFRKVFFKRRVHVLPNAHLKRMATQTDTVNLGELLSACIDAAQQAGEIIRRVWKSGQLDIKDKGGDDPFTVADVQSQQLIMGLINKQWPALATVGEESCEIPPVEHRPKLDLVDLQKVPENLRNVPVADLCVFIDPLDATKEYTLGNLEAVMSLVGIGYKGAAVAGVMYQPFVEANDGGQGTLIWGMVGMGAFGYTTKARKDNKLVIATTRTHGSAMTEQAIKMLGVEESHVMRVGGAGYKALLVLNNSADVYLFPTPGTKKWDTCAPEAIIRALGGSLTDIFGNTYPYFKDSKHPNDYGVVCSLRNQDKYIALLQGLKP